MTQQQMRALEIAARDALHVIGRGYRKRDNASVYMVPSRSEANRWYVVAVEGERTLSCECPAGKYGKIGAHRAAVHLVLAAEARAEEMIVEEDALEAEEQEERQLAARFRDEVPMWRDDRPFSLFKQTA